MNCIKCGTDLPDGALYCCTCGKKQTVKERKHKKRSNNSGSIYKVGGNRKKPYAAKRNGVYLGYAATYAEAQLLLDRTATATITDKYNYSFEQVYHEWKPVYDRTVGESTRRNHQSNYNKWCIPLYNKQFRTLRTDDFQAIVDDMEEDGRAKSTVQKVVQLFSLMSQWAIKNDLITVNYASFCTITAKEKTVRTSFTDDQVAAICASKNKAAPVAMLLIGTGCRPSELFKVRTANCHDTYIISGSKTEKGRNRAIVVCPPGLEAYHALLHEAKEKGYGRLLDAYTGNRDAHNYCNREFNDLMDEIGMPEATPYCCRHTFISRAVKAGVKPELLQTQVGHESYATTIDKYTHLDLDEQLAEMQKMCDDNL